MCENYIRLHHLDLSLGKEFWVRSYACWRRSDAKRIIVIQRLRHAVSAGKQWAKC